MKKQYPLLILICLISIFLLGCTHSSLEHNDIIWEVAPARGGFQMDTPSMLFAAVVDGSYKYSHFVSLEGHREIELYIGLTETIVLSTQDGISFFYRESYEETKHSFTNPLTSTMEAFQKLHFSENGTVEKDGQSLTEYVAVQTGSKIDMPQIDYTVYEVALTWLDQKTYCFRYYIYADGATLISAEAPDLINPQINPDTTWEIDIDRHILFDQSNGVQLPLEIMQSSTGKAVSPESETVSIEYEYQINIYTDPNTGRIEKFQTVYDSPGALITVLHDPQIIKPTITEEMQPMNVEMLNQVLTFISMLEQVI